MINNVEVASLEPVKDLSVVEKKQIKKTSNIGTFLRLILLCVLLTGSIAIFICWHFTDNPSRIVIEDVLKSSKQPQAGNTIFFHKSNPILMGSEYSGFKIFNSLTRHPEAFRLQITPREACAIESAALHNPDQQVFLLYESPVSWVRNSKLGLIATLRNISNVNFRSLDMKRYIANSPFEGLTKPMLSHKFVWTKVAELLGFLTLWRYGGTYLDLDSITLRNFDDLGTNFAALDKDAQELSSKVFSFAPMGSGYHVVKNLDLKIAKILKNICEIEDISDSDALGRELLTDIFQRVCHTKDFEKMQNRLQCFGLRVYDQNQFHGIPSNMNTSILEDFTNYIQQNKNKWYATYDWENFYSENDSERIFSLPYSLLAEANCPKTYAYIQFYEKYIYGLSDESKSKEPEESDSNKSN